jgi:hypothetical protein
LLDDCLNHGDVVQDGQKVIAAGHCHIAGTPDRWDGRYEETACWGQSVSLCVKSRGDEDIKIVERAFK